MIVDCNNQTELDAAVAAGHTARVATGEYTARDNSTVTAWDSSVVTALGNSVVTAWDSSVVTAWGSSVVTAWGSSVVTAWGNSVVTAWGNSVVTARSAFAVTIRRSRLTVVRGGHVVDAFQQPTDPRKWAAMVGLDVKRGRVTLYKRVGDDFTTRAPRGSMEAVMYTPGTEVEAPDWDPEPECGGGLHLCPTPAQCDQFRDSGPYIACSVALADLAIHAEPLMPDKVKARRVKVLYVCDREGNEVK